MYSKYELKKAEFIFDRPRVWRVVIDADLEHIKVMQILLANKTNAKIVCKEGQLTITPMI